MTEPEMREEIERLRRELAIANTSRERLREMLCMVLAVPPPDIMEKEIEEMMKQPMFGIEDIIEELRRDGPDGWTEGHPIPA